MNSALARKDRNPHTLNRYAATQHAAAERNARVYPIRLIGCESLTAVLWNGMSGALQY